MMKKLFYLVLIVVIVLVLGTFVRQNTEETVAPSKVEVIDVVACDCDAKCDCIETDEDCPCAAQKSACDCNSDDVVDNAPTDSEEIVEGNPEETGHEDETIVSE